MSASRDPLARNSLLARAEAAVNACSREAAPTWLWWKCLERLRVPGGTVAASALLRRSRTQLRPRARAREACSTWALISICASALLLLSAGSSVHVSAGSSRLMWALFLSPLELYLPENGGFPTLDTLRVWVSDQSGTEPGLMSMSSFLILDVLVLNLLCAIVWLEISGVNIWTATLALWLEKFGLLKHVFDLKMIYFPSLNLILSSINFK